MKDESSEKCQWLEPVVVDEIYRVIHCHYPHLHCRLPD